MKRMEAYHRRVASSPCAQLANYWQRQILVLKGEPAAPQKRPIFACQENLKALVKFSLVECEDQKRPGLIRVSRCYFNSS